MTRVLFLAERVSLGDGSYLPPHGSAAHTTSSLAGLRASFDVVALTAPPEGAGAAPMRRRVARGLVPARLRGARQDVAAVRADAGFLARAEAAVAVFHPDVVYERSEYLARAGMQLAARLGVPLVLEVNGLVAQDTQTMYRSLLEPLGSRIEQRKLAVAAAVVVESPGMADALAERGVSRERMTIVPNSVSPERLRPEPRVARPDRAVVTWMGHLMSWHREALEFLVASAGQIVNEEPGVRFAIFGGGPGMEELADRAPGAFTFHGVVPYEQIGLRLEETDIALIPDTPPHKLPVKVIEFGAAGLPLVAPRSASLDAQLEPFVEYQPFEARNPESLRNALLAVIRDLELRTRLASGLHAAVRERFTWTQTAVALRGVVERVAG